MIVLRISSQMNLHLTRFTLQLKQFPGLLFPLLLTRSHPLFPTGNPRQLRFNEFEVCSRSRWIIGRSFSVKHTIDEAISLGHLERLHLFPPESRKIAKVVIIGKDNKSDYSSFNSFRPISLVTNLAKFLEKVVPGRLAWLASVKWFSVDQPCFRENRSSETAAHYLVCHIEEALSEQKVCALAFLDIKSAFISAWHPAIISDLANRACPSYLT